MIHELLKYAVANKASDIHVNVGLPPMLRIATQMQPTDFPVVTAEHAERFARVMLPPQRWDEFQSKRDADFAFHTPDAGRFRVNLHYQRGSIAISIRAISEKVRPIEQLHLPEIVNKLTQLPRGLILVTGGTGSGKSTTLSAMIDAINRRDAVHIITLEDPIEFALTNQMATIEQREVGSDVPDFASGLRHVLRQDPDVILVGEMRDLETTSAAITAAETGHLVLSTLHTMNAPQTVERIVDIYPADQQSQVRSMLAGSLQAVVSQTLLRRADGQGMVPAVEIMICTPAVRNCIRENRLFEIPNIIATGKALGMQSLDDCIRQLLRSGAITREEGLANATSPEKLERTAA